MSSILPPQKEVGQHADLLDTHDFSAKSVTVEFDPSSSTEASDQQAAPTTPAEAVMSTGKRLLRTVQHETQRLAQRGLRRGREMVTKAAIRHQQAMSLFLQQDSNRRPLTLLLFSIRQHLLRQTQPPRQWILRIRLRLFPIYSRHQCILMPNSMFPSLLMKCLQLCRRIFRRRPSMWSVVLCSHPNTWLVAISSIICQAPETSTFLAFVCQCGETYLRLRTCLMWKLPLMLWIVLGLALAIVVVLRMWDWMSSYSPEEAIVPNHLQKREKVHPRK